MASLYIDLKAILGGFDALGSTYCKHQPKLTETIRTFITSYNRKSKGRCAPDGMCQGSVSCITDSPCLAHPESVLPLTESKMAVLQVPSQTWHHPQGEESVSSCSSFLGARNIFPQTPSADPIFHWTELDHMSIPKLINGTPMSGLN